MSSKNIQEEEAIDLIPKALEELDRRYQSGQMQEIGGTSSYSYSYTDHTSSAAYDKLIEHQPKKIKEVRLKLDKFVVKLKSLYVAPRLMEKLARSLVVSAMSRGYDVEQAKRQIHSELELVKTQFSSSKSAGDEARTTNSTSAMSRYGALVKLKPAIAEECTATLSPKLYNIVSELNVAWEARLVELTQYKLTVFDPSNTNNSKPFAVGDDNISLKLWFLRQMNLFGVSGWLDNMRLISSYTESTEIDELWKRILVQRRQKLENAGITFIDPSERRKKPGRADELRRKQRKRKLS